MTNKSVNGKTLLIGAPNLFNTFFSLNVWSLKFKCGDCGSEPTVQHNENRNYHKCPVCGTNNLLEVVSYNDSRLKDF